MTMVARKSETKTRKILREDFTLLFLESRSCSLISSHPVSLQVF